MKQIADLIFNKKTRFLVLFFILNLAITIPAIYFSGKFKNYLFTGVEKVMADSKIEEYSSSVGQTKVRLRVLPGKTVETANEPYKKEENTRGLTESSLFSKIISFFSNYLK